MEPSATHIPQPTRDYFIYGRRESLPVPGSGKKTKSGFHYRCYVDGGPEPVMTSYNFRAVTAAYIFQHSGRDHPDFLLKQRPTFPMTGKMDLRCAADDHMMGIVTRSRKFFNTREELLGQFTDARSWKERFGESSVDVLSQVVLGTGDQMPPGGHSDRFGLIVGKQPAGSMIYERLPFYPDPPKSEEPGQLAGFVKKVLPSKLERHLFDKRPPRGWKLSVLPDLVPENPLLMLATAIMTLEINRW